MWHRLSSLSGKIRQGAVALGSKPSLVTRIARTGLGTRLYESLNDWGTSAEIPYRWRVTPKIWVLLVIGRSKFPANQRHYTDLDSDASSIMDLRHFAGKPVVGSQNFGCHSGQLMKVLATPWRIQYVLLFKGHSKHQRVDRGGGGGVAPV